MKRTNFLFQWIPDLLKTCFLISVVFLFSYTALAESPDVENANGEKPRILFMIAEQNIGHQHYVFWWWGGNEYRGETVDMSAAETALKEAFLNKGFDVADISGTTDTLEISNAFMVADISNAGAIQIGKKVNAEIVVKGKALAKEGPRTPGSSVGSYVADVTAEAIRIDNGQVLASSKGHGVSRNISEVTGGIEALSKAGSELADRLIEQIYAKWPDIHK